MNSINYFSCCCNPDQPPLFMDYPIETAKPTEELDSDTNTLCSESTVVHTIPRPLTPLSQLEKNLIETYGPPKFVVAEEEEENSDFEWIDCLKIKQEEKEKALQADRARQKKIPRP